MNSWVYLAFAKWYGQEMSVTEEKVGVAKESGCEKSGVARIGM